MAAASQTVRFLLDGREVALDSPAPTMTILDYLREVAGRRGTKEGCAEGDCGACTVVIGERTAERTGVAYRAVNSCIRFVPTLDGKELVTVESLQSPDGPPHPVQQSMIDQHASQCGFCTPGFVMSLFALYLERNGASRDEVVDSLSGNLCRCTGYRPIIEAGLAQWSYPEPLRWSRTGAQSAGRSAALAALERPAAAESSLRYPGYHAPRSIEELAEALIAAPDAIVLAGGTDVGLWVTKQLRELPPLVYVGDVAALARIERSAAETWIGAAVTFTAAWPALLADFPELREQAARFASPPIRNSATLCGNLANGSPIGDSLPALIALGAQLELRHGSRTRRLPLEDFYLGYQKKALQPGEFVVGVAIPTAAPGRRLASYKVSKRIDQDISAVSATFLVTLDGERVTDARLAFGGMAAIACRARRAEQALLGAGWNSSGIDAAMTALAEDYQPLSDMRASAAYRLSAAQNLLRRFHLEQTAPRTAMGALALRTTDAVSTAADAAAGGA